MIAFYPRNSTVKDNTNLFGVSTILIASFFFFCCLESLSDLFLLLIIGCTGNMSMGAFLLRVTTIPFHSPSERALDEDDS